MPPTTGKPELMKRINRTLLIQALIRLGSATRAELAADTEISVTTVRSLLEELHRDGEIQESALDESSGGRRARRYILNPGRNLLLCLYFTEDEIAYRIGGLGGNTLHTGRESLNGSSPTAALPRLIRPLTQWWDIRAVGLGVPGIVENDAYYPGESALADDIGGQLRRELNIPVILENDLNAIAVGFAQRYAQEHPDCPENSLNLSVFHFNESCTGAGLIADGRVIRGAKRFAGELGFLPLAPGRTLDQLLRESRGAEEAADIILRAVAAVNCVTNPSLAVIGGGRIRGNPDLASALLVRGEPAPLAAASGPEIVISTEYRDDYLAGLARLTAQELIPLLPVP